MLEYINYIIKSFRNKPMIIKRIWFNPEYMDLFLKDLDKYVDIRSIRLKMYDGIELKEDKRINAIEIELEIPSYNSL